MDTQGLVLKVRIHSARLMDLKRHQDPAGGSEGQLPTALSRVARDAAYNGPEKGAEWVEKVLGWSAEK